MGCCSKKAATCWWSCGIVGFTILILISGLIYVILNPIIEGEVGEEFVVDSEESPRYTYWACKYSLSTTGICEPEHDTVAFNEAYYFFNLTNVDDVLNGANPIFEEFGPYYYRVDIQKFDIEFINNGTEVEYNEAKTYYWRPEISCEGCQPTDRFVTINPGYLGAVSVAGNELILLLGLAGPTMGVIMEELNSTYIQALIDADGFDYWLQECQDLDPDCETQFDMALVQWGQYGLRNFGLRSESANAWNSEIFPHVPEYSAHMFNNSIYPLARPLSIATCKKLLYGEKGIVEGPLYLVELLESVLSPDELEEYWGLQLLDLPNFAQYVLYLRETYGLDLFNEVTTLEAGGGIFTHKTVEQLIFDFSDPLLEYMQPKDPQTAIRYNDTSIDDARSYKPGKMAIKTGSDNTTMIANITMWNGTTILPYWAEPIQIFGNNQDGQFFFQMPDGKGKHPKLLLDFDVWSADHGKTIYLTDTGMKNSTPGGIELWRYVVRNETYDVNPLYYSFIQGFVNGSFHMDPPFRKRIEFGATVPLYFSQPRMWGSNTTYSEKVTIDKEPTLEDCATIVDLEPVSGNAMQANKRLQVNFHFLAKNNMTFNRFHPNMTDDIMYPVLYISQDIQVTPPLEEEWKGELGVILDIQKYFFIIGLIVGCLGFVICIIGLIKTRKRPDDYQPIN